MFVAFSCQAFLDRLPKPQPLLKFEKSFSLLLDDGMIGSGLFELSEGGKMVSRQAKNNRMLF
jgi:hypothetical protein|tara:strand:- start:233 stop:418 length:186 start_codon:yes stop_codon:yes gene_type:complete